MWQNVLIDGITYLVKVYDIPSQFGIAGGRVSKLVQIDRDGSETYLYDRGGKVPTKLKKQLLSLFPA